MTNAAKKIDITPEKIPALTQESSVEIQELSRELIDTLGRFKETLSEEDMNHRVKALNKWLEPGHQEGEPATDDEKAQILASWLHDLHARLQRAADDLTRLEAEAPSPMTPEQVIRTENLRKASNRLEEMAEKIESRFGIPHPEKA